MTPFENYALDSSRKNAFNRSQRKSKPAEILVYVESSADVGFWHGILSPYEKPNNIKFDISPYSENELTTGKDKLIKLFPQTGQNFIICLDSDYDYLLPENSDSAKIINQNPYIFQTYAYAIENLKCYAEGLNALCVKATNSTDEIVDLFEFLAEYSKIIYPLLIWNIYFEHIDKASEFSRDEFSKIVTFGNITADKYQITADNHQDKLASIKSAISEKLDSLANNDFSTNFAKKLNQLGLNESNAYLFMQGHALYDFIAKFLIAICENLKNKQKATIEKLAKDDEELRSKTGEYFNSIKFSPITALLEHNDKFKDCVLFKKIEQDIENYLALFKQQTQGLNHV